LNNKLLFIQITKKLRKLIGVG